MRVARAAGDSTAGVRKQIGFEAIQEALLAAFHMQTFSWHLAYPLRRTSLPLAMAAIGRQFLFRIRHHYLHRHPDLGFTIAISIVDHHEVTFLVLSAQGQPLGLCMR